MPSKRLKSTTRFRFVAYAACAVAAIAVISFFAVRETREPSGIQVLEKELEGVAVAPLTQDEVNSIFFTLEGQKLQRDYQAQMAELWDNAVFREASKNASLRMEAVALLLPRFRLVPPADTRGVFRDPHLAELYLQFTENGSSSEAGAIEMGAELSELNILDLQTHLDAAQKEDIRLVYRHVLEASGVQLWASARAAERFGGVPYEPRFITTLSFEQIMDTAGKPGEGSQLLFPRPRECGKEYIEELSRHRPAGTTEEALRARLCTSEIDVFDTPVSVATTRGDVEVRFFETSLAQFPAWSDSNSPVFWREGEVRVINSDPSGSYMSVGAGIDELGEPVSILQPTPERPGAAWLESTWTDTETGLLYGWYHFEPHDLECYPLTAPIIGAAISSDGGLSWEDQGFVIDNPEGYDCAFDNEYFVGGAGDFTVVLGPGGEYFYFLYTTYIGPDEALGVAIARSAFADRGQPETVWKYFEGVWEEPGLGGGSTALIQSVQDWAGPDYDAFWGPSVHWNTHLQQYVMLLNRSDSRFWRQEGVYIAFSHDLVSWTEPEKILESNDWYPQVVGLGANGTDSTAGRFVRLFIGGVSRYVMEFTRLPGTAASPVNPQPQAAAQDAGHAPTSEGNASPAQGSQAETATSEPDLPETVSAEAGGDGAVAPETSEANPVESSTDAPGMSETGPDDSGPAEADEELGTNKSEDEAGM